ncbi:TPA: AbiH family protein [Streptococcus agalactiae]|uniref:AbiH family protein n=1 Tax=Streptococcus agalactiae TaxID=1311 RepID=UPI0005E40C69|nr:AbiH family protein [Streptococcus agalactiae]MDX4995229.1 AbiH family protein [Streptococcus agalactiae]OCM82227.1 hypothetical protein AX248_03215 [Streptococcus agalactiae]CNE97248.1 Uncharacterised protein [Streptococcus agalactiae]
MVNQLIILENGFDRASDLKSGYMDFFNFRFKDSDSTSSFWYYILRSCYNKKWSSDLWSDIEKLISVHLKNIITLYNNETILSGKDIESIYIETLSTDYSRNDYSTSEELTQKALHNFLWNHNGIPIVPELDNLLLLIQKDLKIVEDEFCSYLTNQIEIQEQSKDDYFKDITNLGNNYLLKSRIIFELLYKSNISSAFTCNSFVALHDFHNENCFNSYEGFLSYIYDLESNNEFNVETSILNFNYTLPRIDKLQRNIHGTLNDKNIIFGIDYDSLIDIQKDKNVTLPVEFTKSYKILQNGNIFQYPIPSELTFIKFYGHGLGEADYSYFQSIFDSINLYSSDTVLIFYWSCYNENIREQIKSQQVHAVHKLIEKYGDTFNNKNHGRNLFTKLQLENRLIIQEILYNDILNPY